MKCSYSGLALADGQELPDEESYNARCSCGAVVIVRGGRIPAHDAPANEEGTAP